MAAFDVILRCLLITSAVSPATAYPTGAPAGVCVYLYAKHKHFVPQTSPTPYRIEVNETSYSPNDVIPIRLHSPSGKSFRGFQIRVTRQAGDTEELVGEFINVPESAKGLSWYPMLPGTYNCATHKNPRDKSEVHLEWKAPASSIGDIKISAIFVHRFHKIWAGQNHAALTATEPSADPPFTAEVARSFSAMDHDTCGVTKGCFRYPRGCHGSDCRYVATYAVDEDQNEATIEMMGHSSGYISIAFSKDKLMPMAQTFTCVQSGDQFSFQNGHNPAMHNERHRKINITNIEILREGDVIFCRFKRPLVMEVDYHGRLVKYDIRDKSYLHMAWGGLKIESDNVLDQHKELPIVSDDKINFLEHEIVSGKTLHTSLAAHAVLGVVAWLALAGIMIVTARHYRTVFRDMVCGAALWFQLHRGVMITMAILTAISIIVIFIHLRAWTLYANTHAIIGFVTMGLSLLMILSGFLRPGLDSPIRVYFNWGHRLTGVAAWIMAFVTCVLGTKVPLIEANQGRILFIIFIIWLVFHIVWDLLLELVSCYFNRAGRKYNVAEAGKAMVIEDGVQGKKGALKSRKDATLLAFFVVYVVIVLVFTFVTSYYICLY